MLQSIRDHTQGWIAGIIISMLILSFALWGIHSYFEGSAGDRLVAEVNGIDITQNQLNTAYERLRHQIKLKKNNGLLSEQAEKTIKEEALKTLINGHVLQQAAISQKYRISANQVDTFLVGMPEFQVNGKFSNARFNQFLSMTSYPINDFLALIRSSLLIDQPRLGVLLSAIVLPNEVNQEIALLNQERNIRYLIISKDSLLNRSPVISSDKIAAYYKEHQNDFKTAEKISIQYLLLSLKNQMSQVQVSDAELRRFYSENKDSLSDPVRKIQKPFEEVKDKIRDLFVRQRAEEKFEALREKLTSLTYEHPESLEKAAQSLGIPIQTSGLFTREKGGNDLSSHPKIREIAFSNEVLMLKNNSDLIQLNNDDVVVVRVGAYYPAAQQPLKDVEKQITEKLIHAELNERIKQTAKNIEAQLKKGVPEEKVREQSNVRWQETGFVKRRSDKVNQAILEAAFSMSRPQPSRVVYALIPLPEGYAVVRLLSVKDFSQKEDPSGPSSLYAESIRNAEGAYEYELYKYSMIQQANIVIH